MRLSRPTASLISKYVLVFCVIASSISTANAHTVMPSFKADYRLKHNGVEIGHVTLVVKQTEPQHYTLTSTTETSGLLAFIREDDVVETSEFEVVEGKPKPLNYRYTEQLGEGIKNVHLAFDWKKNRVTNSNDKSRWHMKITDGVVDKALMQIALMLDLSESKEPLSYQVADGGRLKTYQFAYQGLEKISVNNKDYQTIKLARTKDDKPLITYYWCAPSLHMLPVRLTREKSYGTFSMELLAASFEKLPSNPAKITP